jgi:hypothetical protein
MAKVKVMARNVDFRFCQRYSWLCEKGMTPIVRSPAFLSIKNYRLKTIFKNPKYDVKSNGIFLLTGIITNSRSYSKV